MVATNLECLPDMDIMTIGGPEFNMHAYVVDAYLRAVPMGVPGELLLSGPRLALGYAGRPDLTEDKFVPNPCLELIAGKVHHTLVQYYEKAYRTGDLVRWRGDGTLDFMGRIDRQVKITGVRIELGEVEAALEGGKGVAQAVATAVPDSQGQKRLVGYVTPGDVDPVAVQSHCRSVLVPAMVPSVVVALAAFPLLPNGKVDVKSLPPPDWSGTATEEYIGSENEIEKAVQEVFATVLGRSADSLSMYADFFSAGGTSLQVFRAAALLQNALNLESVPATLVHSGRTAHGVAAALSELMSGEGGAALAPISARTWVDQTRTLSANQEQMWLLSNLAGGSAYNMPGAYELSRGPNVVVLQGALDAVAARHEVLRTRFEKQYDGSIAGVVVPIKAFHVPVKVVEVATRKEEAREVSEEAAAAFDLEAEPLLRVRLLVRRAPLTGAVLALTMHHSVGDAWSLGVFWRELFEAYKAISEGGSPDWLALPIQYSDYAAWQRDQLSGESGTALRAFWKETLTGAPAMIQLPQDRPRPARPTLLAGVARSSLPEGLMSRLENVARLLRVNTQAVLLAGLQAVLLRYSGQDDVIIGVPVAGRDRQETHGLVGYFINTLPVRCIASEDATFADMARGASASTIAALEHGLLPLEEVVAAGGVARIPNVNPLFQVLFQYMPGGGGIGGGKTMLGDIELSSYTGEGGGLAHAKMDLSVVMSGEFIMADYMAELFDEATINRLLGSFINVLEQLAEDAAATALKASLLSPQDTMEVAKFSIGEERSHYLSAPLVYAAFEEQAARFPKRRCLHYEGVWLTYGEVEARASVIAGRLAALGVGPGVVVGLMLDRSFELVVSILAILKAGGCYLPCDPSYPDDRLAIYLEDGAAKAVFVQTEHITRAKALVEAAVPVVDVSILTNEESSGASATLARAGPEDPAYIIFTSGSTGRPKGVMVPHRGIRDHVLEVAEFYGMGPDDASLLTITINFDPHLMQLLTPLVVGAGLVIARPDGHTDGEYITELIRTQGVTHFPSTPSLALLQFQGKRVKECTSLRHIMLGGEAMPREVINMIADLVSRVIEYVSIEGILDEVTNICFF